MCPSCQLTCVLLFLLRSSYRRASHDLLFKLDAPMQAAIMESKSAVAYVLMQVSALWLAGGAVKRRVHQCHRPLVLGLHLWGDAAEGGGLRCSLHTPAASGAHVCHPGQTQDPF